MHVSPEVSRALQDELMALFGNLTRTWARQPRGGSDLTRTDFAVLALVDQSEGLRPSDVAAAEGYDASTISRRLASLEADGLLTRHPDPDDRRACRVTTTPAGKASLDITRRRRAEQLTTVLDDWSAQDLGELTQMIARLNATLGAHPRDGDLPEPVTADSFSQTHRRRR